MKFFVGRVILAVSVGFIVRPVDASALQNGPEDYYWSCYSGSETDSVYFTAVWEERVEPSEVYASFRNFLADKYSYKGQVFCAMASKVPGVDLAKAKADQLNMRQHWQKQGKKVVETGWTNQVPAAKATAQGAPAAGAAAPGAPAYWSACQLQRSGRTGGYYTYLSDVFPADLKTTDGTIYGEYLASLKNKFDSFIDAKHGVELGLPQCNLMTSEERMRAIYKNWIDQANKDGKAVMTGWKNEAE